MEKRCGADVFCATRALAGARLGTTRCWRNVCGLLVNLWKPLVNMRATAGAAAGLRLRAAG
eukprot:2847401-Lingulodinium_polyedra.AAC.1